MRVGRSVGRKPLWVLGMAISIAAVIPLYNGKEFIEEALHSILDQTQPPDEIFVVDDGSTDAGVTIVESLARKHPISILSKENGGQSSARNLAISRTSCSHIALLDQDDVWYPDHLELLKSPVERGSLRSPDLVYGNVDRIDRAGHMLVRNFLDSTPTPHPKHSLHECLRSDMYILPGASLFSKAAFEGAGGFDERLTGYEDDDLFVRMFSAGYRMEYVQTPVTKWRLHSGSASYSASMLRSREIYFRKLLEQFPDDPRLDLYLARDVFGPRFLSSACNEFLAGSRSGDKVRRDLGWQEIKFIAPFVDRRTRRRIEFLAPLIEALKGRTSSKFARMLLRWAIRQRRRYEPTKKDSSPFK
jgi:glycosyltransferase involved in cell wall biosynthesis